MRSIFLLPHFVSRFYRSKWCEGGSYLRWVHIQSNRRWKSDRFGEIRWCTRSWFHLQSGSSVHLFPSKLLFLPLSLSLSRPPSLSPVSMLQTTTKMIHNHHIQPKTTASTLYYIANWYALFFSSQVGLKKRIQRKKYPSGRSTSSSAIWFKRGSYTPRIYSIFSNIK